MGKTKEKELIKTLNDLKNIEGIKETVALNNDGLIIAKPDGMDLDTATRFAALAAAKFNNLQKDIEDLGGENLETLFLHAGQPEIVITKAGPDALLYVSTKEGAKMHLLMLEVTKTAKKIESILQTP